MAFGKSTWRRIGTLLLACMISGGLLAFPAAGTAEAAPAGAAQRQRASLQPWERDLLARLVWAEAQGEPYAGQVAVAAVVLNRMASNLFPDTLAGVVYDPWQFEPVVNGWINRPAGAQAYKAVDDALAGWDPSRGALFFFAPAKVTNKFLWSRPFLIQIGRHRFTA